MKEADFSLVVKAFKKRVRYLRSIIQWYGSMESLFRTQTKTLEIPNTGSRSKTTKQSTHRHCFELEIFQGLNPVLNNLKKKNIEISKCQRGNRTLLAIKICRLVTTVPAGYL
jgi:hypothetical protein